MGIEPMTYRTAADCSTTELQVREQAEDSFCVRPVPVGREPSLSCTMNLGEMASVWAKCYPAFLGLSFSFTQ